MEHKVEHLKTKKIMAEANKSKTGLIIIIVMAVLILAAVLYFGFKEGGWFRGAECDPSRPGYDTKGKYTDKCKATPPAAGEVTSDGSQWIAESFPLRKGMWGDKIKIMQQKLKIGDDGKFWTETEGAVMKVLKGKKEVSQADYNSIVSPPKPAPAGGTNFEQLKKNLSGKYTLASDSLTTTVSGKNKKYDFIFFAGNGRFAVEEVNKNGFIVKGTYIDGGTEMRVDGGNSYGNFISHPVTTNMASIVSDIE